MFAVCPQLERSSRSLCVALVVVLCSVVASCGDDGGREKSVQLGTEGHPCYPNSTCNKGLRCVADECESVPKPPRSEDGGDDPTSDAGSSVTTSAGKLGQACEVDGDCENAAWKCLPPAGFPSAKKYCAPRCELASDCAEFEATSLRIQVPLDPDGFGPNAWGTTLLERRTRCMPITRGGSDKYCQFLCPANSAANAEGTSCSCLPRHKGVRNAANELMECVWDDESECSIVNYPGRKNRCDACNSEPLVAGCFTGLYQCGVNRNFNGKCYHGFDSNAISACLSSATFDCDPGCQESCAQSASLDVTCTDLCCRESTRPPSVSPECKPDEGGTGDAGSSTDGGVNDAGRSDGATAEGGSATSDAGAATSDAGPASSDAGGAKSDAGGATSDGGGGTADGGACASFDQALVNITLRSAAGAAPTSGGGLLGEGLYQATAGLVYNTGLSAGSSVGTYAGYLRILPGFGFEELHEGSLLARFVGKGSATLSGTSLAVTYSCASDGSKSALFPYTAIDASSFRVLVPGINPTWITYTKPGTAN